MKKIPLHFRTAFTLLEFLIVIGIMAVLAALLFAGFSRTREAAQQVNCISQLKQIYAALAGYAQDHRGYLPRAYTGVGDDMGFGRWKGVWSRPRADGPPGLLAYVGEQSAMDKLVVCPSNRHPHPPATANTPVGFPYVVNYESMPQAGSVQPPANLWKVEKAKLILMTDADPEAWKGPGFTRTAGWERIGERHRGKANVLWANGEIRPIRRSEMTQSDLRPKPINP